MHEFSGDRYESPPPPSLPLLHYLLLGSRWAPYSYFLGVVLRSRALALKGIYDDEAWVGTSIDIMRGFERCGFRFIVEGLDRLRSFDGPAVIVANHMSTMETVVLPGIINPIKPCTFVVKESLTKGSVWGPIMRARDPIPVSRKDPRADLEAVLEGGARHLASGRSVIVFPQGTRYTPFAREAFNSIGVKLASRTGYPLLPLALKTDCWGNGKLLRGFGRVNRASPARFRFGEAIRVSGRGKAEHEAVLDFIEGCLKEWEG